MGDCGFPMYRVRDACNGRSWEPGYGNVNGSFRLIRKISVYRSQVGTVNLALFYHIGKNTAAQSVFSNNQKTCGVTVQTVDGTEHKGLLLLFKIPGQPVGKGIGKVSLGRMNGNICCLIYDHQVFVLIENRKRHGRWNNVF